MQANPNDPQDSDEAESLETLEVSEVREVPTPVPLASILPPKAGVAGRLATVIVWTFALSIGASFFVSSVLLFLPSKKIITENSDGVVITEHVRNFNGAFEVFKTVSSVMAGPLGFVLGFYFREE